MLKKIDSNLFYASNLKNTADFYGNLGFKVLVSEYLVSVKINDFTLDFIDEKKTPIQNESGMNPKGLGVYTYVEIDNVDEYYSFLKKRGIVPRTEPKDWPWGKREFVIKDPDNYKFVFYSPINNQ